MTLKSVFAVLLFLNLTVYSAAHAARPAGFCQSLASADNKVVMLDMGIDMLTKELADVKTRKWTDAQLREIKDLGYNGPDEYNLTKFYTDRLRVSIERMKTERSWYRANQLIEEIKTAHPEAKLDEHALTYVRNLLEQGVLPDDTVSLEQLNTLSELKEIRTELWDLYPKADRARDDLTLKNRVAELEAKWKELVARDFPTDALTSPSVLAQVILDKIEFRMELSTCCGNSCGGCPIQQNFLVPILRLFSGPKNKKREPTLPLFQLAPLFDGLIPQTLSPKEFNQGERKRLKNRPTR